MKDQRSDAELNRIIAEWYGIKETKTVMSWIFDGVTSSIPAWVCFDYKGKETCITSEPNTWAPSYCTDLNAIHEAVQHLFKRQPGHWDGYWFCLLHEIVTGRDPIEQGWEITDAPSCSDTSEASARQRAEALVTIIRAIK